jgi:uncharacterized membrane protein
MQAMKLSAISGAALATAAAVLVLSTAAPLAPAAAASNYKVKCFGVNACKGHGSCKSTANACKGQNACKGKGFVMMGKATCTAKGGSTTSG